MLVEVMNRLSSRKTLFSSRIAQKKQDHFGCADLQNDEIVGYGTARIVAWNNYEGTYYVSREVCTLH